jgi:hypothetical protein
VEFNNQPHLVFGLDHYHDVHDLEHGLDTIPVDALTNPSSDANTGEALQFVREHVFQQVSHIKLL